MISYKSLAFFALFKTLPVESQRIILLIVLYGYERRSLMLSDDGRCSKTNGSEEYSNLIIIIMNNNDYLMHRKEWCGHTERMKEKDHQKCLIVVTARKKRVDKNEVHCLLWKTESCNVQSGRTGHAVT